MNTGSVIIYIKTDYICKDNARDVKTRLHTPNYEFNKLLPKEKTKKVIGLIKI